MAEPGSVSIGRSIITALLCSWALAGFVTLIVYVVVSHDAVIDINLSLGTILPFIAIGFAAQLVDGSLGFGFGIISNLTLLALGLPPTAAATSVRTAEGFVCGASAVSHAWLRNVDWRVFSLLVAPGIIGSLAGAFLSTRLPVYYVRPAIYAYLIVIAGLTMWRALRGTLRSKRAQEVGVLGLAGGFFDTAGGGGWGPMVSGNLLLQGMEPRVVVGTVAASEFFVTIAISVLLIGMLGAMAFTTATIGLLIGGIFAAPLAAVLSRRIPSEQHRLAMAGLLMVFATGAMVRLFLL